MHFEFAYFPFFLILFGGEMTNTFSYSRSSLENHTRLQTKMAKIYTRFQTERAQKHTLWGGTWLYDLYKGETPGVIL